MDIIWFDLIGVLAFSFQGAEKGLARRYNVSGVLLCAFLTALGGGTVRELLLGRQPIYISNSLYLTVVVITSLLALVLYKKIHTGMRNMLVLCNAIGVSTFAYIGANVALSMHLGPFVGVAFAVLTANGGGIMADLATSTRPRALAASHASTAPAVIGCAVFIVGPTIPPYLLIATCTFAYITARYLPRLLRIKRLRLPLLLRNMRISAVMRQD